MITDAMVTRAPVDQRGDVRLYPMACSSNLAGSKLFLKPPSTNWFIT